MGVVIVGGVHLAVILIEGAIDQVALLDEAEYQAIAVDGRWVTVPQQPRSSLGNAGSGGADQLRRTGRFHHRPGEVTRLLEHPGSQTEQASLHAQAAAQHSRQLQGVSKGIRARVRAKLAASS